MPAVSKRVELSEALEDSPQTQGIVEDLEVPVNPLKDFTTKLKDSFQILYTNQVKVSDSLKTIGDVLDSVNEKSFGEKDQFMAAAMKQLGKYVSELQSWQDMLCAQLNTALVQQLDTFVTNDMTKLSSLKDAFVVARNEHAQSMNKYSRVSKKKETERSRFDANSELFSARRRFHQSSLQYYAELNSFAYKKKFAVLDPLLAFMHSQLAYFKMGHEILTDDVGKFLTSLNVEIQKVRSEHEQMMKQQRKVGDQLEQISPQLCIPDPDPSDPFVEYQPANLHLTKNSGYLNLKTGNKTWERIYFFTKDHLLYSQMPQKAANVFLDLTAAGVNASSSDIDDKRYVFHIMTLQQSVDESGQQQIQKRPMYFQAESAKSRDEWVATIINIVSKKRQAQRSTSATQQPQTRERTDSDIVRMERERVRSFVQQSFSSSSLPATPRKQQPSNPPPPPAQKRLQQSQQQSMKQQPRAKPPPPPAKGMTTVQQILELADNNDVQPTAGAEGGGYLKSFVVRYLGTLEVQQKTGIGVVKDTIRRIIAARALKNLMTVYTVNMIITHRNISLQDQISKRITTQFKLKDVSYCAKHPDNEKLFGMIARVYQNSVEKHVCYVFEAEGMDSGKTVCQSIIEAIKVAVKMITGSQNIPQASEPAVPSFDLPSSPPTSVFNVPPQPTTDADKMSKSLSTGSFQSGSLNLPEDDSELNQQKQPLLLNESFNEETSLNAMMSSGGDVQVPPPNLPPTHQSLQPPMSMQGYNPAMQQQQQPMTQQMLYTPTAPPTTGGGGVDLLDLTTPTVPATSTVTPVGGGGEGGGISSGSDDLMGLEDLQSATEQAQLASSSPTIKSDPFSFNMDPQTTSDPFNPGSQTVPPDPSDTAGQQGLHPFDS